MWAQHTNFTQLLKGYDFREGCLNPLILLDLPFSFSTILPRSCAASRSSGFSYLRLRKLQSGSVCCSAQGGGGGWGLLAWTLVSPSSL